MVNLGTIQLEVGDGSVGMYIARGRQDGKAKSERGEW
jgi:hypothetical protein